MSDDQDKTTKKPPLRTPTMKEWERASDVERESMTWPGCILRAIPKGT